MSDLSEDSDEEDRDVINKLVGRTGLLAAPSRSRRKISLQEELSGISAQVNNGKVQMSIAIWIDTVSV